MSSSGDSQPSKFWLYVCIQLGIALFLLWRVYLKFSAGDYGWENWVVLIGVGCVPWLVFSAWKHRGKNQHAGMIRSPEGSESEYVSLSKAPDDDVLTNIEGIEKVKRVMGRWHPSDLAVIEDFELKDNPGVSTTLVLKALFQLRSKSWPDFDKEMVRVTMVFEGVSDLHLNGLGGRGTQIMGFDIHFVGDRGWERIKYEIEDYEDDRIRFNCGGISIQSAERALDWG